MDDDGIHVGNIHPCLNNGGRHQHINISLNKFIHDPFQFMLFHLPVGKRHICLGYKLLQPVRDIRNRLHAVVDIINLSFPRQFPVHGCPYHFLVIFTHIRLNGHPVHGRLLQNAHIADSRQTHMQRPWNRRRAQSQNIHTGLQLFDLLLVRHAEALFLINDQKPQVFIFHIL